MTVGLELAALPTAVVRRAPGVHQALAVDGEAVWFWTFASPEPRWADVAGTFRVPATPDERAALASLDPDGDAAGGGPALELTVAGRTVRVAAGSAFGRRIGAAVAPLLDRLRDAPVSAVALTAAVVTPPGGLPPVLALTVASLGPEPAVLGLDAGGVRLDGSPHPVPPPRMGLVGADGSLLDGLYAPATVPPGARGAWVLPGAPVDGAGHVRAAGTIRVAGPVPPAAVGFTMTARLDPRSTI